MSRVVHASIRVCYADIFVILSKGCDPPLSAMDRPLNRICPQTENACNGHETKPFSVVKKRCADSSQVTGWYSVCGRVIGCCSPAGAESRPATAFAHPGTSFGCSR